MRYAELQTTTHFSFLRGVSSADELFATAKEFLQTAELAAQSLEAGNGRRVPGGMTIPGVVCTALAAELFLKSALVALRCRKPDQLHSHDLAKLVSS